MPNRRTLLASGHGVILRKDLSEPIPLPTASAPSINETASSLRLSVLPNPARDAAVLRITGVKSLSGTTLHIYDVRGQVVADVSRELRLGSDGSTIEIKLPVDLLRSGSYSVRGVVGGESVQGMFVVAK